ncbi:MAG: carbohydrate-binding protein [Planctomycetes bacterium]|nr:carbohydrate-binding protein [Planctomycetota bacterium]
MMRAIYFTLAGLLLMSPHVTAEDFAMMPPAGYDQAGQYPAGTVHWNVSYYSSVAGRNLNMHVYTPPGYNPSQKYGVIYCYQGIGVGADTTFLDWSIYANVVCDNLIGQGKIQPVIIVALDDQFDGDWSDVAGMTINDAIPFVDSHYSTYGDADHRGLYGYSWGGGYAFNVGCANLDTFHHLSPTAAAPNKAGDNTLFPNGGAEAKLKLKTLFISWGQYDYESIVTANVNCHNFCTTNGIDHYWWEVPGAGHWANEVWRPAMWNFLQMADAAGISGIPEPISAYSQIEAEAYHMQSGTQTEECTEGGLDVGFIENGDYLVFRLVDFEGGAASFNARVASAGSGGQIELYLDSLTGIQIGSCAVPVTGGWQTWTTVSCPVSGAAGQHDVYMKFTGPSGYLFNINWWQFSPDYTVPPMGLTATTTLDGRIDLTWNEVTGGISYNVKRSTNSGGPYTVIAPEVETASFSDTEIIGDLVYYYVVSANTPGGESADSAEVQGIALAVAPSAPSGLRVIAGDGTVALNWTANGEGDIAGYQVYRSTTSGSGYVLLNSSLLSSPEFIDDTAVNFRLYNYVVTAVDFDTLESAYSHEVQAIPNDETFVLLAGTDFESGFGDWVNIAGEDSHDWTRDSNGTLTPNTGPSGGAEGSSWYVYLETSPGGAASAGNTAILESPVIEGYGRFLAFYYHLYGVEIGILSVDVYDGVWHTEVWSISGQQHTGSADEYTRVYVDLTGYNGPIRIRLRATAVGGPRGDMAVDNIEVFGRLLYGDMDGDTIVDMSDLSEFIGYWLQEDCGLDLDGDCVITLYEFARFAENWLND